MKTRTTLALAFALAGALAAGTATLAYAQDHGAAGHAAPTETHAAPQGPTDHAAAPGDKGGEHGAGEHAAAEHAAGHHSVDWADVNWADFGNKEKAPFLSQLVNFAILIGIFWFFGKKPIADGLKARRSAVAKEIEEAQRMRQEAEERAKTYQAKLEKLEEELVVTKNAFVEAGKGERDRIIKDAEEKAERMVREAKALLEQEAKQLKDDLVRETVAMALESAEEVLKQRITSADHERLADDYLAGLMTPRSTIAPPPRAGGS